MSDLITFIVRRDHLQKVLAENLEWKSLDTIQNIFNRWNEPRDRIHPSIGGIELWLFTAEFKSEQAALYDFLDEHSIEYTIDY